MKLITLAFLIFCIMGCTNIQVSHKQKTAPELEKNDKIAVILNRFLLSGIDDPEELEEEIASCVKDELLALSQPIEVILPIRFRETVFPGMDYELVPSSPESIYLLLQNSVFQEKLHLLGIRYLILTDTVQRLTSNGGGFCGAGPGGGGCLAIIVWNNEAKLASTIIDVKRKIALGNVDAKATSHPFLAIVLIAPIGLPAFSEGPSCHAFGKEIANFFRNQRSDAP